MRYSNAKPVEVPKHVKEALGWWFTDEELQWAERKFRAAHPNAAPEPGREVPGAVPAAEEAGMTMGLTTQSETALAASASSSSVAA